MEFRKHKRVATGVPGDACVICGDKTSWDDPWYMGMADELRKETLEDRHTVIKTEAHIFQHTVEGGTDRCHSCGHGEDYPLHRDFSDYDEMLADFRSRKGERDRKISKTEWESRQPVKPKRHTGIFNYPATAIYWFFGGAIFTGCVALMTGWGS